jgi:hypothetical protein
VNGKSGQPDDGLDDAYRGVVRPDGDMSRMTLNKLHTSKPRRPNESRDSRTPSPAVTSLIISDVVIE